jgi:hypothetical protein
MRDPSTGSLAQLLLALRDEIVAEVRRQVESELRARVDASGYLHGWTAASGYTGIPESTLKRTEIPRFRVGDRVVFSRSEIDDWLERFREKRP